MDSTHIIGLLLVGLSAMLLATHWQQWRDSHHATRKDHRWQDYSSRQIRRRTVASSLIGLIGFMLLAVETVPRTPIPMTSYLLCLLFVTCWILWLACLDMIANRRFHETEELDRLAEKLRQAQHQATKEKRTTNESRAPSGSPAFGEHNADTGILRCADISKHDSKELKS